MSKIRKENILNFITVSPVVTEEIRSNASVKTNLFKFSHHF